jgi:predicted phosphodiesterase
MAEKQKLLQPVLDSLAAANVNSPWRRCHSSLYSFIKNYKVILYSAADSDLCMHAIKIPFANYVLKNTAKNFRGIRLRASATQNLTALVTQNVTLFNLAMYRDLQPEVVDVLFSSSIANLKNQHVDLEEIRTSGRLAARSIHTAWMHLGDYFMRDFYFDICADSKCGNLSKLSYDAIWLEYTRAAGVFHQGIEKTKPAYEKLIRAHSKGGYSWSCQDRVNAGEKFVSDSEETAKTILEYDITSSYPAAVKNMRVPTGFAVGYKKSETNQTILQRCDPVSRHKTFEYKAVFYTLSKLEKRSKKNNSIRSVYSNFSQLGFFKIGKYPLDLAVVFENGAVALYNFDGQYVHGCPVCPLALKSYVGGQKSRQTVEAATRKRDDFINKFISSKAGDADITYTVLSDCHGELKDLHRLFRQDEKCSELVGAYPESQDLPALKFQEHIDAELTFIALVRGHTDGQEQQSKPIIQLNKATKKWERCSSSSATDILLTRDTLEWLQTEHKFVLDDVSFVLFHKTCKVLPRIYDRLVRLRASPDTNDPHKKLLKKIGNYSCGYFGSNPAKKLSTSTFRLVHSLPEIYDISTTQVLPVGHYEDREFYFVKRTKANKRRKCMSALPLFYGVVEYGKTRISQILCFLEKYLDAATFRHLYTNVDNLILCLSKANIDACIRGGGGGADDYFREKENFFKPSEPGHAKLEWLEDCADWRFSSAMTQNYALIADSSNSRHKNSALSAVTSLQSYDMSCSMLDRQRVEVTQVRRLNKLASRTTAETVFVFK